MINYKKTQKTTLKTKTQNRNYKDSRTKHKNKKNSRQKLNNYNDWKQNNCKDNKTSTNGQIKTLEMLFAG